MMQNPGHWVDTTKSIDGGDSGENQGRLIVGIRNLEKQ